MWDQYNKYLPLYDRENYCTDTTVEINKASVLQWRIAKCVFSIYYPSYKKCIKAYKDT